MSDTKRFDKVLQKFQEVKEQLVKYDEKRQDGVNVEPPMTAGEKTKKAEGIIGKVKAAGKAVAEHVGDHVDLMINPNPKQSGHKWSSTNEGRPNRAAKLFGITEKAEFLAMTKSGQWSLHKGDGKSQGGNPPKSENRKKFEKEIKDVSPDGEDPVKGAEEVDSAEIKRKYKAGEGSGASKNYLHKGEPQPGEPSHEKEEKKAAKDIKGKAEKLLDMHKMDEGTTMAGDYNMTNIEKAGECTGKQSCQCNECRQNRLAPVKKNDLPKDAEYQKHKKEAKERA